MIQCSFRVCVSIIYMLLSRDLEVEWAGAITNCLGSVFFKWFLTLHLRRWTTHALIGFVKIIFCASLGASSSNLQLSLHLLHFIVNLEEEWSSSRSNKCKKSISPASITVLLVAKKEKVVQRFSMPSYSFFTYRVPKTEFT